MIDEQDVERFLANARATLVGATDAFAGMQASIAQGQPGGGQFVVIRVDESVEVPEHQHDYDEFCLVLRGRVVTWINGQKHISEPGDLLYEPANVPHRARIEGPYVAIDFFAGPRFSV